MLSARKQSLQLHQTPSPNTFKILESSIELEEFTLTISEEGQVYHRFFSPMTFLL
jgi:hypothetical protein